MTCGAFVTISEIQNTWIFSSAGPLKCGESLENLEIGRPKLIFRKKTSFIFHWKPKSIFNTWNRKPNQNPNCYLITTSNALGFRLGKTGDITGVWASLASGRFRKTGNGRVKVRGFSLRFGLGFRLGIKFSYETRVRFTFLLVKFLRFFINII